MATPKNTLHVTHERGVDTPPTPHEEQRRNRQVEDDADRG